MLQWHRIYVVSLILYKVINDWIALVLDPLLKGLFLSICHRLIVLMNVYALRSEFLIGYLLQYIEPRDV